MRLQRIWAKCTYLFWVLCNTNIVDIYYSYCVPYSQMKIGRLQLTDPWGRPKTHEESSLTLGLDPRPMKKDHGLLMNPQFSFSRSRLLQLRRKQLASLWRVMQILVEKSHNSIQGMIYVTFTLVYSCLVWWTVGS